MMATRLRTGNSFAKSVTAKGSEQPPQTDNTRVFLLRLLKETVEQSWERLPSSAQGNCRRHGRSLTATASCGRGVKSMETQMVVSSTAGVLAKAHTSSYLWFSHNHICMPFFFWTKIYIFIKNWSSNFNDFIYGLESGSKGTDPIMTRRLRDRKIKFLREKEV